MDETKDVRFTNENYKKILEIISSLPSNQTFNDVFNAADDKLKPLLIDIVAVKYEISDMWNDKFARDFSNEEDSLFRNVRQTILILKRKVVQSLIKQCKEKLVGLSDDHQVDEILKQLTTLKKYEIMIFNEIQNN